MITEFTLNEKEQIAAEKFMEKHKDCTSFFRFIFVPTGIGVGVEIECECGASEDITDYDRW